MSSELKVFSGRSNRPLAEKIAAALGKPLGSCEIKDFSDGEMWVKYSENIRGSDVYIVQSTNPPAENLLELLIMIDAARRASARKVVAVIPYFGYARQDRKDQPRVSITAKLVANLITVAGATTGDPCLVGQPSTPVGGAGVWSCYVSAADTVRLRFCNPTAAAIDPASAQFHFRIVSNQ